MFRKALVTIVFIATLVSASAFTLSGRTDGRSDSAHSPSVRVQHPTARLVSLSQPRRVVGVSRWRDPLLKLPVRIQRALACVRYIESRDHVVDGPSFPGAGEGLYQFIPSTWNQIRAHEPWLAPTPNKASRYQQDQAACWEYHHNGRLGVAWYGDYSCLRMAGEHV